MTSIHLPPAARHLDRRCRRLAMLLLPALAVMLAAPMEVARAGHLERVGLIEDSWDGVAIKGYDPVAYFQLGRAVKGSAEFRHEWLGQEWHFVKARHRDLFAENPVKYVPQYGGYCSESHSVSEIEPTAWRIVDGRLYLFFSEASAARFEGDGQAQSSAERYWDDVKGDIAQ